MVFDPSAPPRDRDGFITWYVCQTQWDPAVDCNDPNIAPEALRRWFFEMIAEFPAMNGPHASEHFENPKLSDYCFTRAAVFACFAWSELEAAYCAVLERARKHGVGFFDISADDGEVWLPDQAGHYVPVHGSGRSAGILGETNVYVIRAAGKAGGLP